MMTAPRRLRLAASALAVTAMFLTTSAAACLRAGERFEDRADGPIITDPGDVCQAIRADPAARSIVGSAAPDPDPFGKLPTADRAKQCFWPPTMNPHGWEIRVQWAGFPRPAQEAASNKFEQLVHENACEEQLLGGGCEPGEEDRKMYEVFYGDFACAQASNPRSIRYLGIIREANVVVTVELQTGARVQMNQLAGLAKDPNGPLHVLMRVADVVVHRPDQPSPPIRVSGRPSPRPSIRAGVSNSCRRP